MNRYLILLALVSSLIGCKKDNDPPTNNVTPRSLSGYEQQFEGDWILIRVDLYDANGVTFSSIDQPGSPNHPDSLYNGTQWVFVNCDPYWYHYNFAGNTCNMNSAYWQMWYGNLPANTSNACWSAGSDTLNLSGVPYLVEYIDSDSLVYRQTIPGAGYRNFLKRN